MKHVKYDKYFYSQLIPTYIRIITTTEIIKQRFKISEKL